MKFQKCNMCIYIPVMAERFQFPMYMGAHWGVNTSSIKEFIIASKTQWAHCSGLIVQWRQGVSKSNWNLLKAHSSWLCACDPSPQEMLERHKARSISVPLGAFGAQTERGETCWQWKSCCLVLLGLWLELHTRNNLQIYEYRFVMWTT